MLPPIDPKGCRAGRQDVSYPIRARSISHHEDVAPFRGMGIERGLIHRAPIPPDVDHDRPVTSSDLCRVKGPLVDPRQPSRIRHRSSLDLPSNLMPKLLRWVQSLRAADLDDNDPAAQAPGAAHADADIERTGVTLIAEWASVGRT